MTTAADREGLREALAAAERFRQLSVAVTQWTWDPSQHEVTLRLPRESEYAASRELMQAALDLSKASPLSDLLAQAEGGKDAE